MNICIVGAGIFGMAAALELRNRGHEITLIERGQIPNPEASSTDVSKVIRRTNYPNETYVELVTRAAAQWQTWHNRTSRSIYFQHGALIVSRDLEADHETHAGWETLIRMGKDVYELTAGEVRERFPQFTVSDEDSLFFDPWAGYLRSGRALEDLAKLASAAGVTILENTLVTAVEETPSVARVRTESEWKDCDRAVVSAGPWVCELVPEMKKRVRITRQQMAFFAPEDPGPFERTRFPVWMIFSPGNLWYGFPYLHEGFVKVAEDSKWDDAEVDVSREPTDEFLAWAREFVARRIPGLNAAPLVGGRSCLYTNMANMEDEEFVIDWARGCERVLIAGCGCGHGFKFGGAIGPVIADAVEDRENPLGDLFRIGNRFD